MAKPASTTAAKPSDEVPAVEGPAKTTETKRAAAGKKRKSTDGEEEGEAGEDAPASAPAKKVKTTVAASSKKGKEAAAAEKSKDADPFSIELEGDEDESVPLYDSCDELRKKINKHLDATGKTKSKFLQEIARAGWPVDPPKIQTKQLSDFQTKKGATSGSTSKVAYGAYVYFEKLRLAKGEKKSRHR